MGYIPRYTTVAEVRTRTGLTSTEVSDSDLTQIIYFGESELDNLTGKRWDDANAYTEYFEPRTADVTETHLTSVILKYYPIQSITYCAFLNDDGSVEEALDTLSAAEITAGTYYSDDYWVNVAIGKLQFIDDEYPSSEERLKVSYTYGNSTIPSEIVRLAASISGMRAWTGFLGGNYNSLTNYSIPEQSVGKGDLYARGEGMMAGLKRDVDELLASPNVGRRSSTIFSVRAD
jgi:hypothetical protein